MKGGGDTIIRSLTITFNNYCFKIKTYIDDEDSNRKIIKINNKKKQDCIIIFIDKPNTYAQLENISVYKDCECNNLLPIKGGGLILLEIAIKYLTDNKSTLKINRIVLQDNSFIACFKQNLKLGDMHILKYGHTWYGLKGFRPFSSLTQEPDLNLLLKYNSNIKILNKIKVSEYPQLFDLIYNANIEIKCLESTKIKSMIEKNKSMLLKTFFNKILKNIDCFCLIYSQIYGQIFLDLNITSFHQNLFYLDL
jgi:hypothetical protein